MEEYVEIIENDDEVIEIFENSNETISISENVIDEIDPTVPNWVKAITREDIDKWNQGNININSIPDEVIESIVKGSYNPDENNTSSILGQAILGTMVLQ